MQKKVYSALTARGGIFIVLECVESICGMILARKMSKDVENGPLPFELAHFGNIFVPKPAVGTNFRQVEYFLVVDEKMIIFCDFNQLR